MLILSAAFTNAQTRPAPEQLRSWKQVAPPKADSKSQVSGTRVQLEQLAIDPAWIDDWLKLIGQKTYDHYRVAISAGQTNPVLILCLRPETDPLGPGCVGGLFWFATK